MFLTPQDPVVMAEEGFIRNWNLVLLFIALNITISSAQDYLFRGGHGIGYGSNFLTNSVYIISLGGNGIGYANDDVLGQFSLFSLGGIGSGFSMDENLNFNSLFSLGGIGSGYFIDEVFNNSTLFTSGGEGMGYFSESKINNSSLLSLGGVGDGYVGDFLLLNYWSGDISSNWNIIGNWSSNSIPVNKEHVIIPGGRPHNPILGNQLLSIGDETISTGYKCASLWIQSTAMLSSSAGSTLNNWSKITINGTMEWNNPSVGGFNNKPGSELIINNPGILIIKN